MAVTVQPGDAGIATAADTVRDGGTIIYPTETCYGLGGDALDEAVIDRVYELKERPRSKGLTVIVADLAMAEEHAVLTERERRVCRALMPGPLTLIARKQEHVPAALNTHFAFRVPGNAVTRRIVAEAGVPVIATSANISGEPSCYRVEAIADSIRTDVDCVVDAGELARQEPSTVIDLTAEGITVYREGPVDRSTVEEVLG